MVVGVDRFRAHFAGHEHQFVLIGGAACELIFDEVGLSFRATKDFDIVLIVEALDPAFSASFFEFIDAGGYEIRQRSEGERILYRFQKPSQPEYPAMLELFSRSPKGLAVAEGSQLTPIPIDEEAASLSAILLDSDYYEFLKAMVRTAGNLPVLDASAIIPFKARAWLDLSRRKEAGEKIDSRNVTKHRNDVARLAQLLRADATYELPPTVRNDMAEFLERSAGAEDFQPQQMKLGFDRASLIERLRAAYAL
jgi:hypothetical protein